VLLTYSAGLDRQLILNEASYRSIRGTILGLEKSQDEEKVSIRSRRTWPPYREEWDGTDERRRFEDDLSRSVKAGIYSREAGYPEVEYDRAIGALGGAMLGRWPTVQTRSGKPRLWTGRLTSLNIYSTWAAQVKATRSANEAWKMFESPPEQGLKPNFQVYAEMFEKLLAHQVLDPSSAIPGESREVFPPYEVNLTSVEKARLQPPSVQELYERMLRAGNRPVGKCLALLVAHSSSHREARQYLLDSPFREYVSTLTDTNSEMPTLQSLRKIPLPIFNAYISLLCKLPSDESQEASSTDSHIRRAIKLVSIRLSPSTPEGRVYKSPWHSIVRALAMARHRSGNAEQPRTETLSTLLDLIDQVQRQMGMDVILFEQLSIAVFRAMSAIFLGDASPTFMSESDGSYRISLSSQGGNDGVASVLEQDVRLLQRAHSMLVSAFEDLSRPAREGMSTSEEDGITEPAASISALHIYRYVRALRCYGDSEYMAKAVRWILSSCSEGRCMESSRVTGTRDHAYISRILQHIQGTGNQQVVQELKEAVQQLNKEGIPWIWPDNDEMDGTTDEDDVISMASIIASHWLSACNAVE
jgi:DNA (cytosine-5)-methyltransferase 1